MTVKDKPGRAGIGEVGGWRLWEKVRNEQNNVVGEDNERNVAGGCFSAHFLRVRGGQGRRGRRVLQKKENK